MASEHSLPIGFEVLIAVVMKSSIFWDITLRSLMSQPTFRRNMAPPSSGSKSKPSKKPDLLAASFMFVPCCLLLDTEHGEMFLRNFG
jgi:hypothetical protein